MKKILCFLPIWFCYFTARIFFRIADQTYLPDTPDPPWFFKPCFHSYSWLMDLVRNMEEWAD